jgi:hypothetical protein
VVIGVIIQFIHGLIRKYIYSYPEDQVKNKEREVENTTTEEPLTNAHDLSHADIDQDSIDVQKLKSD